MLIYCKNIKFKVYLCCKAINLMKNNLLVLLSLACAACTSVDEADLLSVESDAPSDIVISGNFDELSKSEDIAVSLSEVQTLLEGSRFDSPLKSKSRSSRTDFEIQPIHIGDTIAAYAVNYSDGGFMLLSASKTMNPVLAHSPSGSFNADVDNPALSSWLESVVQLKTHRESLPFDSVFDVLNHWEVLLGQRPQAYVRSNGTQAMSDDPERDMQYQLCLKKYDEAINEAGRKGFSQIYFGGEMFSTDEAFCNEVWEYAKYNVCPAFEEEWQQLCFLVVVDDVINEIVSDMVPTYWGQKKGFNYYYPVKENGENQLAGCAPVAIGQLMYFYQFPDNFDWANMSGIGADLYNAALLWDIAQRFGTGTEAEGATNRDRYIETLRSYGYETYLWEGSYYPLGVLSNMKINKRPILLRGPKVDEPDKGHVWLATGYIHKKKSQKYVLYYVNSPYTVASSTDVNMETFYNEYSFWMKWGNYGVNDGYYITASVPDKYSFNIENVIYAYPK